ncbi:sensor histidine kinase [Paenibacillus pinihumi]|uniref:sensor histidine kinase n=1 Tax=Paenibacillus pinihumi TaxID=669462 RepID=UPI001B7FA113|nr:HAMP domain-containing sensor histidine kinase [Paenibacillus pinihumi]
MKWKLMGFIGVLLLVTLTVLSLLVLQGIKDNQLRGREQSLQIQAELAGKQVRQMYITGERTAPEEFMQRRGQELAVTLDSYNLTHVLIYDRNGRRVGNSSPMEIAIDARPALEHALNGKIAYITEKNKVEYFAPLPGPEGLLGVVQLGISIQEDQEFYQYIERLFLLVGMIVTVSGLLFGYWFVARQARAIRKLMSAADQIGDGRYLQSPVLMRGDELGELGRQIYAMSGTIEQQVARLETEKRKLQEAVERLELLEQSQKQFINNFSHEFKTPVTSIKAYADLLGMYNDDPGLIREATSNMSKEAERLSGLVDQALQLSLLNNYEPFASHPEPVDLAVLLEDACGRMNGKALKFGIMMHLDLSPVRVFADRDNLLHIFINLLDNAIKYNVPQGQIRVSSALEHRQAVIRISDTGIGIAEDERERVFEPFYTVNKDRSRASGGTGLGLALVKSLVEKQNGSIRIEGDQGQGTKVTVVFPAFEQHEP